MNFQPAETATLFVLDKLSLHAEAFSPSLPPSVSLFLLLSHILSFFHSVSLLLFFDRFLRFFLPLSFSLYFLSDSPFPLFLPDFPLSLSFSCCAMQPGTTVAHYNHRISCVELFVLIRSFLSSVHLFIIVFLLLFPNAPRYLSLLCFLSLFPCLSRFLALCLFLSACFLRTNR